MKENSREGAKARNKEEKSKQPADDGATLLLTTADHTLTL
jgi:hypothetical protein